MKKLLASTCVTFGLLGLASYANAAGCGSLKRQRKVAGSIRLI